MKKAIVLAVCTGLISGCATSSAQLGLTERTPKAAIEQAEAAQASDHTWMWWTAGGLAAALAIGLAAKHGSSNNDPASAQPSGCNGVMGPGSGSVTVGQGCGLPGAGPVGG